MDILNTPEFKHSQAIKSFNIGGREFERIPWGNERGEFGEDAIDTECTNCSAPTGSLHLLSCDLEQCPRCDQQAISCACAYEQRPDEL